MMREHFDASHRSGSVASLVSIIAVGAVAGSAGFWVGGQGATGMGPALPDIALAQSVESLSPCAAPLLSPKRANQAHIDFLGAKIGELQAEVLRVNALGQRLVEMAGLSIEEFDFREAAPAGGPDRAVLSGNRVDEVAQDLAGVLADLGDRKRKLVLLETLIMERDLRSHTVPDGWPLATGGVVTSTFGMRRHPITGRRSMHKGIDIAGKLGASIVSTADGIVVFSGRKSGYGNIVEVRHANGLETRYAHNQRNLVQEGDLVRKGQVIAKLGSTGRSTGPHVHFEVRRNGKAVDPSRYLDLSKKSRLARL